MDPKSRGSFEIGKKRVLDLKRTFVVRSSSSHSPARRCIAAPLTRTRIQTKTSGRKLKKLSKPDQDSCQMPSQDTL